MICRNCGCDDDHACPLGCYWIAPEVCSNCANWRPPFPRELPAGTKYVDCIMEPHVFVKGLTVLSIIHSGERPSPHPAVRLWNPKMRRWEDWAYIDYFDVCPVDKTPMRVFVVRGTTWLACCSESCYDTFVAMHPEMFVRVGK